MIYAKVSKLPTVVYSSRVQIACVEYDNFTKVEIARSVQTKGRDSPVAHKNLSKYCHFNRIAQTQGTLASSKLCPLPRYSKCAQSFVLHQAYCRSRQAYCRSRLCVSTRVNATRRRRIVYNLLLQMVYVI